LLIAGTLSKNITMMTSLTLLELGGNNMTGTIPASLAIMSQLTYLGLGLNQFYSTIPSSLGNLMNLGTLQLFQNSFTGSIPPELGYVTNLQYLDLAGNELNGPFPPQLCNLTNLLDLTLGNNALLEGTLPSCIGDMVTLKIFSVVNTSMSGPIPSEIGLLSSVRAVYLETNYFSRHLPSELGLLTTMTTFYVDSNLLSGPIPSQFGQLESVMYLNLGSNVLSGPLPPDLLFGMTALEMAYFYGNFLSGPIPQNISRSNQLVQFAVNPNMMTGTVPGALLVCRRMNLLFLNDNYFTGNLEFHNLTNLLEIYAGNNFLTGSISNDFGQMTTLQKIVLPQNLFTNSIPSSLGHFPAMREIDLHGNLLSRTIPSELFNNSGLYNETLLSTFDVSANSLSGTIPGTAWHAVLLRKFNVSNNFIEGPISPQVENLRLLTSFDVNNNFITSTIPAAFGDKSILQSVAISNNYISGPLPPELRTSSKMESFAADNNFLSGSIVSALQGFSSLQFINLSANLLTGTITSLQLDGIVTLDISENMFSGFLPDDLFAHGQNLSDVILYSNCFSGSLPVQICEASSLRVLVMDSVTSAPACDERFAGLAGAIFKVKIGRRKLSGSIPNCMWTMPNLNTLHLAGNGLLGSIGNLGNSLEYVSLSSNRLTGSVPLSWQASSKLVFVDLSSNRLSGSLSDSYLLLSNSSLDLSVNRLSGDVPATFRTAENINVLNENLFQCDQDSKPLYDPTSNTYVCGSSNFNTALTALGSVSLFVIIVAAFRWTDTQKFIDTILHFNVLFVSADKTSETETRVSASVINFSDGLRSAALWNSVAGGFILVVPMISYLLMKLTEPGSAAYSTHSTQYTWVVSIAFLHGSCPFTLLVIYLFILTACSKPYFSAGTTNTLKVWCSQQYQWWINLDSQFSCSISRRQMAPILSTVLLVIFNCVVILVVNVAYVFTVLVGLPSIELFLVQLGLSGFKIFWSNVVADQSLKTVSLSSLDRTLLRTFMVLFTFLASPVLATFFTNDSCFRDVITGLPAVTTSFNVQRYECSNECHVLECFDLCAMPSVANSIAYSTVTPSWIYSYQCSSALLVNYVPVLLLSTVLSGIVIPLGKFIVIHFPQFWSAYFKYVDHSNKLLEKHPSKAFNGETYISRMYLNLGILMTFGLACPLLVFGIVIDSWSSILLLRFMIMKYVSVCTVAEKEAGDHQIVIMKRAHLSIASGVPDIPMRPVFCLIMVFVTVVSFWSIFCFDMIADVYGDISGIVVVFAPLWTVVVAVLMVSSFSSADVLGGFKDSTVSSQTQVERTTSAIEMNQRFTLSDAT
jgi:Leucine-rich repeat (LRR) protein